MHNQKCTFFFFLKTIEVQWGEGYIMAMPAVLRKFSKGIKTEKKINFTVKTNQLKKDTRQKKPENVKQVVCDVYQDRDFSGHFCGDPQNRSGID